MYARILRIANTENAVNDGLFFDLMYANQQNAGFDTYSQYAFFRKCGKEVLLVVANFSGNDVEDELYLPNHAFDYLDLPEKVVQANDLLSDGKETTVLPLKADGTLRISVSPYSCKVYKFNV